jgi:transposase
VPDTATGGIRAAIEAPADGAGYARMLGWARKHAPCRRVWALEGTGSFVAGLAGELALAGEDVVEVGALRHARGSTNDPLDAVRTKAINELKSLIVVAPEQLWAPLRGRPLANQVALIESTAAAAAATVEHRSPC